MTTIFMSRSCGQCRAARGRCQTRRTRDPACAPRRFRPRACALAIAAVVAVRRGRQLAARAHDEKEALRAQLDARGGAPAPLPRCPAPTTGRRGAIVAVVAPATIDAARADPDRQPGPRRARRLSRRARRSARPTAASCSSTAAGSRRARRARVLPDVPPPAGRASTVEGRARRAAAALSRARRAEAPPGSVWQNLDPARFADGDRASRVLPVVDRADRGARRRRRRSCATGRARLRHREAPDLHAAVVRVRGARGRAVARAQLRSRRDATMTTPAASPRHRAASGSAPAHAAADRSPSCIAPVRRVVRVLLPVAARRERELRRAAADRSRRRRSTARARRRAVPPGRSARPLGAAGRRGGGAATPAASASSTRRARRARCRAGSRSASRASGSSPTTRAPDAALLAEHPGLVVARVGAAARRARCRAAPSAIYLVDPLGNLVLRLPRDPDIQGVSKDLERLLKASSIG